MKQVVINLVRNAIEAMPGGGDVVRGDAGSWTARPGWSCATTGPGLPEGLDVFQLFVTTKPKGTGLGLSIVAADRPRSTAARSRPRARPGEGAAFTSRCPLPGDDGAERRGASMSTKGRSS